MTKKKGGSKPSRKVSQSKAKKILKDGEVRGHPLTPKQKKMFGAAAGRSAKRGKK